MATKYEHVSSGNGFSVLNGTTKTQVINQDGTLNGSAIIDDASITAAKLASDAVTTAKILNANVTTAKIADSNVTTAKIADANVTSAKLDAGLIQTVQVSLTAANIIGMYATPVLVLAGIASKKIYIDSVDFTITRTATAFTGGGVVDVQYDSTANGGGTTVHADIAATVVTGAAGTTHTHRIGKDLSDTADASITAKGLYISNKTAAFAAGTGTAVVTVRYYVV